MSTPSRFGEPDWPRLLKKVEQREDGCWQFTGARRGNGRNEYGAFWANGTQRAHIVAYVWACGEPNADLHHTCDNPLCVNPEHLVPASSGQPRHRNANPQLCANGHEFTPENTYIDPRGWRQCKTCAKDAQERHIDANRPTINARRRENREHVTHEPRQCEVCGTVFTPKRVGSGRGRLCTEPPKTDVVAYKKWRDCVNERQRRNRNGRLGR